MPTSGFADLIISGLLTVHVDFRRFGVRRFSAAFPDDEHHVDVAEGHEESWNHEYVGGHECEVELALPPCGVALACALVLDHALRVHPNRHLRNIYSSISAIIATAPKHGYEYFVHCLSVNRQANSKNSLVVKIESIPYGTGTNRLHLMRLTRIGVRAVRRRTGGRRRRWVVL